MRMQIAQTLRDLIIALAIMDTWEMDSIALVNKSCLLSDCCYIICFSYTDSKFLLFQKIYFLLKYIILRGYDTKGLHAIFLSFLAVFKKFLRRF